MHDRFKIGARDSFRQEVLKIGAAESIPRSGRCDPGFFESTLDGMAMAAKTIDRFPSSVIEPPSVKSGLQSFLLRLYKTASASGVTSTTWGRFVFEWCYERYKVFFEVGDIRVLRSLIQPGTTVIDVGANVGFFTKQFGRWVSAGGRVIAIEPEEANFSRLNRMIARNTLSAAVETIQAVAAETNGTLKLEINPFHPADHKISEQGIPVKAVSLDHVLEERQWPPVSLIKIDVQGAEERVLRGAPRTIERFHPALFLEMDGEALRKMSSDAGRLLGRLTGEGYSIHRLERGRISAPLPAARTMALCQGGRYADFLFLYCPESDLRS